VLEALNNAQQVKRTGKLKVTEECGVHDLLGPGNQGETKKGSPKDAVCKFTYEWKAGV
jgi:hypothetical protein